MSTKEAVADPTWVQSTIVATYSMFGYFVVAQMVYMGTVNNT